MDSKGIQMVESNPTNVGKSPGPGAALIEFGAIAVVLGAVMVPAALYLYTMPLWSIGAYGVAMVVAGQGLWRVYPHAELGLCNIVTMARLALTALLFGALFEAGAISPWVVFGLAVAAFVLDGVDGYLARQAGLESRFGARFDMETDAALGAILATWLLLSGAVGPQILILGYLRYVFILASSLSPVLNAPLPMSLRRKAICAVQIGALIFLTLPGNIGGLDMAVSLIASGLLLYSFTADTVWLLLRRG